MATDTIHARPTLAVTLRDAVLGRPTAGSWLAPILQLLLVLLWYRLILVLLMLIYELVSGKWIERTAFSTYDVFFCGPVAFPFLNDWAHELIAFRAVLFATAVQGAAAYMILRQVERRGSAPVSLLARNWWRTCLWGTALAVPGTFLAAAIDFGIGPSWHTVITALVFFMALLAGPAALARMDRAPRRRSRWRPVCPECGYSLHRLREERCPECGAPFPTRTRVFRRWAVQRLLWDRVERGNLLFAYVKTVFTILLCPDRAARGVANPDRFARAARWAGVHASVLALLAVAVAADLYWPRELAAHLFGSPVGQLFWESEQPAAGRLLLWASQSLVAWLLVVAALPLLGVFLCAVGVARHRAAQLSLAKWSLYATMVVVPAFAASYVVQLAWFWHLAMRQGAFPSLWQTPPLACQPLPLLVLAYGVWWALGVAVNPYMRTRGNRVFLRCTTVFLLAWLVLTRLLFNMGLLRELL